jgi:hypothetical protein
MNESKDNGITKLQGWIIIVLLCIMIVIPYSNILKPTPQWEYEIKSIPDDIFISVMNGYGKDGCELVFARRVTNQKNEPVYEVIFKRPLGHL